MDEIDVSGKYVVPGLMDMHIHISVPVGADDPGADETPVSDYTSGLSAMYALNNARNLIAKGVTTIRDAGSHGLRESVDGSEPSRTTSTFAPAEVDGHCSTPHA